MRSILLLIGICWIQIAFGDGDTKTSRGYLQVELPSHFKLDPLSLKGERKWWAKHDDPASGLSVATNSYGYISELDLVGTIPGGWDGDVSKIYQSGRTVEQVIEDDAESKTIESYFQNEIVPDEAEMKAFRFYDRYIARTDSSVSVFYFNKAEPSAIYGHCYETLQFSFPDGSYATHREMISQIIESARPWLSRLKAESNAEN